MKHFTSFVWAVILLGGLSACQDTPPANTLPKPIPTEQRQQAPGYAVNDPNSQAPEPPFIQEGRLVLLSGAGKGKAQSFNIEIADDEKQRQQGLMYRKKMEDAQGMLFTFEAPTEQSFWMRNTYIPLDIIYINEKLEVVSIQKNCKILNDTPLPSGKPAMYVFEINGGLSDKLGIKPGDKMAWQHFLDNQTRGDYEFPSL